MQTDIFNGLNESQKAAVKEVKGPSVILAGAGSGKTRVLVTKVLNLILNQKVNPADIAMITFTNKAAGEMKERINRHLQGREKLGYVGTYHSLCARILRIDGIHIGLDRSFT